MANPHFAKFADIWKHVPLLEVLRIERPSRYWETHAGTALYPLTPSPEREYGIYHFLRHVADEQVPSQSAYNSALTALPSRDGIPTEYPGSAVLAMLVERRDVAEYLFCDKDPASAVSLKNAAVGLGLKDRTRVVRGDGPGTIWTASETLPSGKEGTVVCHLDPFNSFAAEPGGPSSLQLFERLARKGIKAIYWYAYERPDERGWLLSHLTDSTHVWCGDVLLPEADESGLVGLGVALANVSLASIRRCAELGRALERLYASARLPSGAYGSISFVEYRSTP
jgi:23S rRNA (adenine2030-N6)-methyltransferase